ncbi:MAG: 3-oxoacyl-[acyl-carrier-protein] synthase III C-terminal domain-containing protein [Gammaproteobacteria bacterium]
MASVAGVSSWPRARRALAVNDRPSEQLNRLPSIEAVTRKLKLPRERVVLTIREHRNTSAAPVPLALDVAVRDRRIRRSPFF